MAIISFSAHPSLYVSSLLSCVKKFRLFDSSLILNRGTQAGVQKTTKARNVPLFGPSAPVTSILSFVAFDR
jgi:hypothetical protein